MITISDVALKCGVSITTVSMVINNKGNISQKTRQKVMHMIEELNFIPNDSAKTLKQSKTGTICLILSELGGYFHSELIRGIEEKMFTNDEYTIFACSANEHSLEAAISMLTRRRYDGYIVFAPLIEDRIIHQAAKRKVPIVMLDRRLNSDYIFNILIDNFKGATEVLEHLSNSDKRKVGIVRGTQSFDSDERFAAVMDFQAKHNLEIRDEWIMESKFTKESGYRLGDYVAQLEEKPDAIFCFNDESAIGLIRRLRELGIRIPSEISIVGFDDIEVSSYLTPALSTVQRPMYDIGALSVDLLVDCYKGMHFKETIRLDTTFIKRGTS